MELSIISVNWNSADYLLECIDSIYKYTQGVSFEIIVVDNNSPDGRVYVVGNKFPEVIIVKSTENIGFSGANNLGVKHSTGKYLLFLNPDIRLVNPAINTMLEQLKSLPDAGIVGCKHLSPDFSVQTCAIQKFPTILNQIMDIEYFRLRWPHCRLWEIAPLFCNSVKPTKVEVIPGACMMLRREVFEEVGGFSDHYFMYAEDIDLNYKVASLGLSSYYVGQGELIHYGGRSSVHQKANQWATIMRYRAMLKFYRKTRGRRYAVAYRIAMGCGATGRLVLLLLMFPIGGIVWEKESLQGALTKWNAVLKWAVGLDRWALGD